MSVNVEARNKLRRTINDEFVRLETDFDDTRDKRSRLIDKLMKEVDNVKISDSEGNLKEEAGDGIRLITTALKALSDVETANIKAIGAKLKQAEIDIQSSQAAKDRIEIVLRATAPGKITEAIPHEQLEEELSKMFDADIKDFELRNNNRDLTD